MSCPGLVSVLVSSSNRPFSRLPSIIDLSSDVLSRTTLERALRRRLRRSLPARTQPALHDRQAEPPSPGATSPCQLRRSRTVLRPTTPVWFGDKPADVVD